MMAIRKRFKPCSGIGWKQVGVILSIVDQVFFRLLTINGTEFAFKGSIRLQEPSDLVGRQCILRHVQPSSADS